MRHLYEATNEYYELHQITKPPMVHLDRFRHQHQKDIEEIVDHILFTIPRDYVKRSFYQFPSTFIGSQGLFDAYKFLYSSSDRHKNLVDDDGVWVNLEFNSILTENLISDNRDSFRKQNDIGETVQVLFASPGSNAKEFDLFIETIKGGAAEFVNKYIDTQKMSKENFTVVVSVPESKFSSSTQFRARKLSKKALKVHFGRIFNFSKKSKKSIFEPKKAQGEEREERKREASVFVDDYCIVDDDVVRV